MNVPHRFLAIFSASVEPNIGMSIRLPFLSTTFGSSCCALPCVVHRLAAINESRSFFIILVFLRFRLQS